jgi:hypothetical protein
MEDGRAGATMAREARQRRQGRRGSDGKGGTLAKWTRADGGRMRKWTTKLGVDEIGSWLVMRRRCLAVALLCASAETGIVVVDDGAPEP